MKISTEVVHTNFLIGIMTAITLSTGTPLNLYEVDGGDNFLIVSDCEEQPEAFVDFVKRVDNFNLTSRS